MEGISPRSDSVSPNGLVVGLGGTLEGLENLAETLGNLGSLTRDIERDLENLERRRTFEKITYIALGAIAFVVGLALLVTGLVLFKAVFPLGIFAAAAIPLTAAVKAQVAGYFAMMIAGLGLQLAGVFSVREASRFD